MKEENQSKIIMKCLKTWNLQVFLLKWKKHVGFEYENVDFYGGF